MSPIAELVGVSKRFPGVLALDNVSITLARGEVHALVGENGAGKSTLIKLLTGVYTPDAGEIRYAGRPVSFRRPLDAQAAGISTIYQEVNLLPRMSVASNLYLGREPRGRFGLIDHRRMYADAAALLSQYGIDVDVRAPLQSLGLGAQQMVALARAVSVDARVVIMDEPTSSLEPREVDTLFRVVRDLRGQGVAIMYVSHRLDELYRICDRVTVLRDGRVVHTGPLAELDRLRLVSLMLGRDVAEVRRHGLTRFSESHTAAAGEPVLRVRDLTRRHVLSGVSFDVRPGEVTGLGGLLGSGRSETAKAIVGALPVERGEVTVAGRRLRRLSPAAAIRAGISLLPEDRKAEGIIPELSVRENIVLAAMPRLSRVGVVSRAQQDRVVDLFMKRLRIKAASPDQKVSELSGGNQQKVLLARWLCLNPKVLLLDEPTRGIDVGAKAEVQQLIDDLAQEGLAVVLISSDLEELVEGADRIVVLHAGAVVDELAGDDVSESHLMAAVAHDGEAPE
ncbi:sugar ABC transporter ATP-binding protein [Planosporangium mesophilum]|uniref:Sugar ABC transporter ATP-binding protein n=1 Tax=Planosporangium mesophilum TaxID=689768 RepID=A0A8J3TEB9_9ACTN|nr:sugar ABC transporter ATP-binding protein [Planosporangium mesophilum]NJC84924.1 sugar ABC transporter ATP-binding protein [Planosporangium mesophilum]GII23607.1 sugar ABC transporter ATP-binding protein [Planosporangium mesophilum]